LIHHYQSSCTLLVDTRDQEASKACLRRYQQQHRLQPSHQCTQETILKDMSCGPIGEMSPLVLVELEEEVVVVEVMVVEVMRCRSLTSTQCM
jgi:hypothetical protein